MADKYFNKLNYTLGDEDSSIELAALNYNCNHVFAIAGSGGRILPLLAKEPSTIHCVDILIEQLFITELRIETVKNLNYEEFCGFWGYPPAVMTAEERKRIFEHMPISDQAKTFLRSFFVKHNWDKIIYLGRFEKMLIQLSKVNSLITGKDGKGLFYTNDLSEQRNYYVANFPSTRWKIILFLLGNSTVLNSILYKGEFPKKNIPGSTYENFRRIFDSIFKNVPIKSSFFAQMAFWGEIRFPEGNLIESKPEYFNEIKRGAQKSKIHYVQGDIIKIVKSHPVKVDFLSLSDVPSFMKGEIENSFLQEIKQNMAAGSMVIVRGNLRVTNPNRDGYVLVNNQYNDIIGREATQLWQTHLYERTQDG